MLLCYEEYALKLIFKYNSGNSNVFQYQYNFSNNSWQFSKEVWFMWTFILHTKAYHIACEKHLHCTPKYIVMIELSLEFTRHKQAWMYVTCAELFHIVHSFDKFEASNAQDVSPAHCFCYSHKWNLSYQTLHCKVHTWGLHGEVTSWCRVHCTKCGFHIELCSIIDSIVKIMIKSWVDAVIVPG